MLSFIFQVELRELLQFCSSQEETDTRLALSPSRCEPRMPGMGGGGVLPYETDGDARRLA